MGPVATQKVKMAAMGANTFFEPGTASRGATECAQKEVGARALSMRDGQTVVSFGQKTTKDLTRGERISAASGRLMTHITVIRTPIR